MRGKNNGCDMKFYVMGFLIFFSILSCVENEKTESYKVKRLEKAVKIDAVWEKAVWTGVQPLSVGKYMGEKPDHFPRAQAKLAYDDAAIYVIWRVEDRYVRAVAKKYQDPVYEDSCVEFFLTPGSDISRGYFNLEMNCGGTALFHFQQQPKTDVIPIPEHEFDQIQIAHSLPKVIDPEIKTPTAWTVEYRIPFSVLEKYSDFSRPESGTLWRANFYKCADKTSHPHWLTWAKIDYPKPNFHLPAFFGELYFE